MCFKLNSYLLLLGAVCIQGKHMAARQDYDEAGKSKEYHYNADEGDDIGPRKYSKNDNFGNGNSGYTNNGKGNYGNGNTNNGGNGNFGGWCVLYFLCVARPGRHACR